MSARAAAKVLVILMNRGRFQLHDQKVGGLDCIIRSAFYSVLASHFSLSFLEMNRIGLVPQWP